ncbi:hypothetical protein BDV18DRAFT_163588 [Aspergillus unguis]
MRYRYPHRGLETPAKATTIIPILSLVSRIGIFISSIIALSLNARFLTNVLWANDLLIYIIAIASFSAVACLVPPYPNFLFDLFWTVANGLSAVFALVVQFAESDCYGFRPGNTVSCATYKAGTAFTFILALAWGASALLGALRILGVVFNIGHGNEGDRADENSEAQGQKAEQPIEGNERRRIPGFGNAHIARHPIYYALLAIVLLAAGIPLLIVYAAPAFVVYIINNAPIPDTQINLLNPTNDSIQFSLSSDVRVPSAVSVRLDAMNAQFFRVQTMDDPVPFATVDIPKLRFSGNDRIQVENQTMRLADTDQFAEMIEDVSYNPTFDVAARARTKVGIATLSRAIDFVKVDTMDGFDNFPNIGINDISIRQRDDQNNNIFAEVELFNPISATVTLGDVTLTLHLANQSIGQATVAIDNLVPGNNTFNVRAQLNGTVLSDHIEDIIREQIPYLQQGNISVSATGESVVYDGQHLAYWEKAFRKIDFTVTRDVREILDMILGNGVDGDSDDGDGGGLSIPGLPGLNLTGGFDDIMDQLIDQILDRVGDLDDDDVDDYAEELGTVGRLVLRLLTSLGVM